MHEFLLGQEKDTFDAFIHHVNKNLDINRANMKYRLRANKQSVTNTSKAHADYSTGFHLSSPPANDNILSVPGHHNNISPAAMPVQQHSARKPVRYVTQACSCDIETSNSRNITLRSRPLKLLAQASITDQVIALNYNA